MPLATTLTTPRLLLRPFAAPDAGPLVALAGNYKVAKHKRVHRRCCLEPIQSQGTSVLVSAAR